MFEDFSDALVGSGGTLEILVGTNLLCDIRSLYIDQSSVIEYARSSVATNLLRGNRLLRCLVKFLNRSLVVTQVLLATDQDGRQTLAEMENFGDPLCLRSAKSSYTRLQMYSYLLLDVVERVRGVDGETDEDHVGIRV